MAHNADTSQVLQSAIPLLVVHNNCTKAVSPSARAFFARQPALQTLMSTSGQPGSNVRSPRARMCVEAEARQSHCELQHPISDPLPPDNTSPVIPASVQPTWHIL